MRPERDETDNTLFEERKRAYNDLQGIRVGDYLRMPDGKFTRATHIWRDEDDIPELVQDGGGRYGSFYLGEGYCSYSGGLDPGVKAAYLCPTHETEPGHVWFFHHDCWKADNGVYFTMDFRVFEYHGRTT